MTMLASLVLSFALVSAALADTPANCTYEDIRGTWSFHIGPSGFDNTVNCSRLFEVQKELTIELKYPDIAIDGNGYTGFWTLIYNQGFEVVISGRKYFAFSKYTQVNSTVISYCDTTSNGWSHSDSGKDWACYFGTKVVSESPPSATKLTHELLLKEDVKTRKYMKNEKFINEINRKTKLWEAVHYPEYEEMTLLDLLNKAGGIPKYGHHAYPKTAPVTDEAWKAIQDLPESFDWRNNNGTNYVSPIRNQEKCGSCYAFGSMAMLEARIRIISNNSLNPVFSTQDIVSCSEYSQGCEGGFPYLIAGKYAEDFGVVEESCLPYKASDVVSCSRENSGCTRYRATNYFYIGGYYGACNEQLMLANLVQKGPIAVSFEVTNDFLAYKKGIYHKVYVEDGFNPWEITNHVVSIVGYGVENGVKYWTVKNSWGEKWGEEGYFRIVRGTDELSIESMAVAATPILP